MFLKSQLSLANIPEDQAESVTVTEEDDMHNSVTLDYTQSVLTSSHTYWLGSQNSKTSPRAIDEAFDIRLQLEDARTQVAALTKENIELRDELKQLQSHKPDNQYLLAELEESQVREKQASEAYQRMMGQVKEIFKKQRDLIHENELLHTQVMKAEDEVRGLKQQLTSSEKKFKQHIQKMERDLQRFSCNQLDMSDLRDRTTTYSKQSSTHMSSNTLADLTTSITTCSPLRLNEMNQGISVFSVQTPKSHEEQDLERVSASKTNSTRRPYVKRNS